MSRIDLKAIDATFVRGLSAYASGSSGASKSSSSSNSATQVSLGLRVGAQTYAQSLRSLNSVISTVNVSKATLEKLGEFTDQMIEIADKATKSFVSDATRRSLDGQLKRIANKFKRTANEADVGGRDLLSKDGLEEVFALVGLDPKNAESIAKIFDNLTTPKKDLELASESSKGSRPVNVPVSASGGSSTTAWRGKKESSASQGAAAVSGIISQNAAFWIDDDNYNNQNPSGYDTLAIASSSGNLNSLAGPLPAGASLLSVSETSGYALIKSTADYLGYNLDGVEQVYVVDNTGQVLQQVTNNSDGTVVEAADLSADGLTVAVATGDGANTRIDRVTLHALDNTDPTFLTSDVVDSVYFGELLDLKIDEAGSSIAAITDTSNHNLQVYNSTNSPSINMSGLKNTVSIGFIGQDKLGYVDSAGNLWAGTVDGGAPATLESLGTLNANDRYAFSEGSVGGVFGILRGATGALSVYDVSSDSWDSVYTVDTPANISSISLADDGNGGVSVGVFGRINNGNFSDSTNQLYRFSNVTSTQPIQNSTLTTGEPDKLFNGTISKRPEAFRMLSDLKALREQISTNIKALDQALTVIGDNVKLVRATGLAMLDIRNELTGSEQAEEVARLLRDKIASNAGIALLAQAENLTPIAYAELNRGLESKNT